MSDLTFSVESGFYDSINKDRLYSADDMNRPFDWIVDDGIYKTSADSFGVSLAGAMAVSVKAGMAKMSGKWLYNSAAISVNIEASSPTYDRIDSIILRVNVNTDTRAAKVIYRTGTPAETPAAPALVSSTGIKEFRLANILVEQGATSLLATQITDTRGSEDCPWAGIGMDSAFANLIVPANNGKVLCVQNGVASAAFVQELLPNLDEMSF